MAPHQYPTGLYSARGVALRKGRLMRDIQEMMEKPYPGIQLRLRDGRMDKACLVLTPDSAVPLHLTVVFGPFYPLIPPIITIQTNIVHPNVFRNGLICASILHNKDGYTPAYTLQGIAIQMLSFFGSDTLEQENGGTWTRLTRKELAEWREVVPVDSSYSCRKCGFHYEHIPDTGAGGSDTVSQSQPPAQAQASPLDIGSLSLAEPEKTGGTNDVCHISHLPNEVLLEVIAFLDFEELTALARSWPRISDLITHFDVIRQRELQCFVLKTGHQDCNLGIGVSGRNRKLESEFDLISDTAFNQLGVRKSVHGLPFSQWLPLPLSQRQWGRMRSETLYLLNLLQQDAGIPGELVATVFTFMNDVVARLNDDLLNICKMNPDNPVAEARLLDDATRKSTLRHPSEKAVESYFHLFHLLLCLATDVEIGPGIVAAANKLVAAFAGGDTSKATCPNLGHLLIALLLSDTPEVTQALRRRIVREAVTRNVVWMLDGPRGAGAVELAFLERDDAVSHYRLKRTFEASRASYRLLMFSELFRATARPDRTVPLATLRDELFARHGGPPPGVAGRLVREVRRLQEIDEFPDFLRAMGIDPIPDALGFCKLLRLTVRDSMEKGYSTLKWLERAGISQEDLRRLRQGMEEAGGGVGRKFDLALMGRIRRESFFPRKRRVRRRRRR